MGDSLIEWTDKSWSPTSGCAKVSEGCRHCFAERMATRFAGGKQFPNGFAVTLHPERLEQPLHWRTPRRVFVCPTGDLFHDDVPDRFIDLVFAVMALTGRHTYQVLTKRADRMAKYMRDPETPKRIAQLTWVEWSKRIDAWVTTLAEWSRNGVPWPLPNVWLGVTAENQEMADRRIPLLLQVPAAVRFVSVEPMLGPVDLEPWLFPTQYDVIATRNGHPALDHTLGWVIVGGETGPGARPMHPDWVRKVRDDCRAAGVPPFFKSWGEWAPATREYGVVGSLMPETGEAYTWIGWDGKTQNPSAHGLQDPIMAIARVGKARAGHLLDGQEWHQFPEVKSDV